MREGRNLEGARRGCLDARFPSRLEEMEVHFTPDIQQAILTSFGQSPSAYTYSGPQNSDQAIS